MDYSSIDYKSSDLYLVRCQTDIARSSVSSSGEGYS